MERKPARVCVAVQSSSKNGNHKEAGWRSGGQNGCLRYWTQIHPLESHITLTNRNRCSHTFVPEPKNALGRILFIRNVYE